MAGGPTCGQGLAEHSALPAGTGELIESLAENLESHLPSLDRADPASEEEHRAYASLVEQFRAIAGQLDAAAREMDGYRDLPMGRHDQGALARPEVMDAFRDFLKKQEELIDALRSGLERDRQLLG